MINRTHPPVQMKKNILSNILHGAISKYLENTYILGVTSKY